MPRLPDPIPGQTGHTPRVELNLPLVDPTDMPRPEQLPEFPDPHSTTGQVLTVKVPYEGDDRAKTADDSATGSSDTAVTARK